MREVKTPATEKITTISQAKAPSAAQATAHTAAQAEIHSAAKAGVSQSTVSAQTEAPLHTASRSRILKRTAKSILHILLITILLAAVLVAIPLLQVLKVEGNVTEKIITPENPYNQLANHFAREFSAEERIRIRIGPGSSAAAELWTQEQFQVLNAITEELEAAPYLQEVVSLANLKTLSSGEFLEAEPFIAFDSEGYPEITKERLDSITILRDMFLSEGQKGWILYVYPKELTELTELSELVKRMGEAAAGQYSENVAETVLETSGENGWARVLQPLLAKFRQFQLQAVKLLKPDWEGPQLRQSDVVGANLQEFITTWRANGYEVAAEGGVYTTYLSEQTLKAEFSRVIPITVAVIFLLYLFFTRRLGVSLLFLCTSTLPSVIIMGLYGYLSFPITPRSILLPALLFSLTTAYSIHYIKRLELNRGDTEKTRYEILPVILFAAGTTVMGYVNLLWVPEPSYQHLGLGLVLGLVVSMLTLMIIIIPLLERPRRKGAGPKKREGDGTGKQAVGAESDPSPVPGSSGLLRQSAEYPGNAPQANGSPECPFPGAVLPDKDLGGVELVSSQDPMPYQSLDQVSCSSVQRPGVQAQSALQQLNQTGAAELNTLRGYRDAMALNDLAFSIEVQLTPEQLILRNAGSFSQSPPEGLFQKVQGAGPSGPSTGNRPMLRVRELPKGSLSRQLRQPKPGEQPEEGEPQVPQDVQAPRRLSASHRNIGWEQKLRHAKFPRTRIIPVLFVALLVLILVGVQNYLPPGNGYLDFITSFRSTSLVGRELEMQSYFIERPYVLNLYVDTKEEYGLLKPETYSLIEMITSQLRKDEAVDSVISYTDVTAYGNGLLYGEQRDIKPADEVEIGETLEMLASQEVGVPLSLVVDQSYSQALVRVVVSLGDAPAGTQMQLADRIRQVITTTMEGTGWLEATNLYDLEPCFEAAPQWFIAGLPEEQKISTAELFTYLGKSSLIFLLVTTVLGMVYLQSFQRGLLVTLPSLIAVACFVGLAGWLQLSMNGLVLFSLYTLLGVSVDDTIYLLGSWVMHEATLHKQDRATNYSRLVRTKVFQETGISILETTTIVSVGILPLCLSSYHLLAQAIGITIASYWIATLTTLFILPRFLHAWYKIRKIAI